MLVSDWTPNRSSRILLRLLAIYGHSPWVLHVNTKGRFTIGTPVLLFCQQMSRITRTPTLWNLRKVSTQISLSISRRLTRTDTFRLLWLYYFRNHYSLPLSLWNGICRPGLACADFAGWFESIMLVISWNGSDEPRTKLHVDEGSDRIVRTPLIFVVRRCMKNPNRENQFSSKKSLTKEVMIKGK